LRFFLRLSLLLTLPSRLCERRGGGKREQDEAGNG
jgi:hypothetical protein